MKTKKLSSILWASLVCSVAFALCQPSFAADAKMGADRHIAKGLNCQTCHGNDMKNPQFPEEATCVQCHNKEALAEKLKIYREQIHIKHLITETALTAISSMSQLKTTALNVINLTSKLNKQNNQSKVEHHEKI